VRRQERDPLSAPFWRALGRRGRLVLSPRQLAGTGKGMGDGGTVIPSEARDLARGERNRRMLSHYGW